MRALNEAVVRGMRSDWTDVNHQQCQAKKAIMEAVADKDSYELLWQTVCPLVTCHGGKNTLCHQRGKFKNGAMGEILWMRTIPHWERFHRYDPKRFSSRRRFRALLTRLRLEGKL